MGFDDVGAGPLRIQILGPLRVWRGDVELDVGPRQQAYLLALLLAREGRPTSKDELINLIWGEQAPESARNLIHKYIGALRRVLEPTLPARRPGSYLLRRGDNYLCAADRETLDLATFRHLVGVAGVELAERRCAAALDGFVEALELWHGPAGDGLPHGPTALPVFAGLNGEFFDACTTAAELAVSVGRPDRVLRPLRLAATMAPLHEPVQASLVTALGAAGQQAEALSVFSGVRSRLADDLGIQPGRALADAHGRVLGQGRTPQAEARRRAMYVVCGHGVTACRPIMILIDDLA